MYSVVDDTQSEISSNSFLIMIRQNQKQDLVELLSKITLQKSRIGENGL